MVPRTVLDMKMRIAGARKASDTFRARLAKAHEHVRGPGRGALSVQLLRQLVEFETVSRQSALLAPSVQPLALPALPLCLAAIIVSVSYMIYQM